MRRRTFPSCGSWPRPPGRDPARLYGRKRGRGCRATLLDYAPSVLVSIERQGATDDGHYHYGRGEKNIPDMMAKIDRLFELAKQQGFYTIGIGDGGNELGMANVREAFGTSSPSATRSLLASRCPCWSRRRSQISAATASKRAWQPCWKSECSAQPRTGISADRGLRS